MEAKPRKCPTCGADGMADGTTEIMSRVGPRTFVAAVPAEVCGACGESIVTARVMRAFEEARARALVEVGASDGDALRWVRKAAGLTGKELARLLGVAPETVSRWEHNGQVPDRAAVALLGALALDAMEGRTSTRDRLDALASAASEPAPATPVALRLPSAA